MATQDIRGDQTMGQYAIAMGTVSDVLGSVGARVTELPTAERAVTTAGEQALAAAGTGRVQSALATFLADHHDVVPGLASSVADTHAAACTAATGYDIADQAMALGATLAAQAGGLGR